MEPTPHELEAAAIRWRAQHPAASQEPTPDELESCVAEIREYQASVEATVLAQLKRATRNGSRRGVMGTRYGPVVLWILLLPFAFMVVAYVYFALGGR